MLLEVGGTACTILHLNMADVKAPHLSAIKASTFDIIFFLANLEQWILPQHFRWSKCLYMITGCLLGIFSRTRRCNALMELECLMVH